jgi:hypothetical protein
MELVRAQLRRSAMGRLVYRFRRNRMADVFVLSFPKTGRTWLRVLLGKALALHHGLQDAEVIELDQLARAIPSLPRIRFKHDDNPHFKAPHELVDFKYEYRDRKVVLLVRDPRDTLVSAYFQMTKREDSYRFEGTLADFLRCPRGSWDTMIRFYNIWADQRSAPAAFLLVRYEDLHADAARELRRVLEFLGYRDVAEQTIQAAVEFSRFENMRKMEQSNSLSSGRLKPGDAKDPESFKTRKGKVGGYVDYLDGEQIAELNARLKRELAPIYGY